VFTVIAKLASDSKLTVINVNARLCMTDIERLQKAIKDLHGCDSEHLLTTPVREIFQGKVVWEGDVEVFQLKNHPSMAILAYAWSYKTDDGETRYVAVLGLPPVHTALDAVRAYIASHPQKQR
jgi:hypothetical protein